eukprot:CAMPEP_0198247186 /NCGR_PEP_ID=MMETSP1446-20131203/46352_1 /TAXON_ID=1461542 ORGANISM="Unidentified sp, Strain CCMP2111" /NCGR_SAMPLE_ID=MMETSP1446 /ASSEMBLY_ACC=CAM_ASM_001112 /LENGTH=388 /DNA_ID=CAMNT_0043931511 /DNA_START=424 /DNA_END=1590 /DNA_ORIENTATION=-
MAASKSIALLSIVTLCLVVKLVAGDSLVASTFSGAGGPGRAFEPTTFTASSLEVEGKDSTASIKTSATHENDDADKAESKANLESVTTGDDTEVGGFSLAVAVNDATAGSVAYGEIEDANGDTAHSIFLASEADGTDIFLSRQYATVAYGEIEDANGDTAHSIFLASEADGTGPISVSRHYANAQGYKNSDDIPGSNGASGTAFAAVINDDFPLYGKATGGAQAGTFNGQTFYSNRFGEEFQIDGIFAVSATEAAAGGSGGIIESQSVAEASIESDTSEADADAYSQSNGGNFPDQTNAQFHASFRGPDAGAFSESAAASPCAGKGFSGPCGAGPAGNANGARVEANGHGTIYNYGGSGVVGIMDSEATVFDPGFGTAVVEGGIDGQL